MKLIKLTRPDGSDIWIAPTWIISVADALLAKIDGAHAEIKLSSGIQFVQETAEEIALTLEQL